MSRIRGIEYQVTDDQGDKHWLQFGDSSHDLASRGYAPEPITEVLDEAQSRERILGIMHQVADGLIEIKET